MRVQVGVRSLQYYFYINFWYSCLVYFVSVFWFVSCPEIYLCKKMYLVNRLETNRRKSLIPFHAIWGLCWYNFVKFPFNKSKATGPKNSLTKPLAALQERHDCHVGSNCFVHFKSGGVGFSPLQAAHQRWLWGGGWNVVPEKCGQKVWETS